MSDSAHFLSDIGRSDIRLSPISLITDIGLSAHLWYCIVLSHIYPGSEVIIYVVNKCTMIHIYYSVKLVHSIVPEHSEVM
jgi:hypothetical protein